uniref:Uncharacterized protein n=1 Tax=Rhizophora mucronata TaxID=61149 RepID=A0A2P2Q742_RHIMU
MKTCKIIVNSPYNRQLGKKTM